MTGKKKFYAVAKGRKPGIYTAWFGENGAQVQVQQFEGAVYKGFATIDEAEAFMKNPPVWHRRKGGGAPGFKTDETGKNSVPADGAVILYTDGSALNNPGPGGYGVVIIEGENRRELSAGFRKTTNNRMELLACIVGLESLPSPGRVFLYSDSAYVVNGISKGWAKSWKKRGWMKSDGSPALNPDLWDRLLTLCERHCVNFNWVRGHAGNPENERCDQLATSAAAGNTLAEDTQYERNTADGGVSWR